MRNPPVLLDLFCGGGGAGLGYKRAGFEVIGIDIEDHRKSFGSRVGKFDQMDWEEGLEKYVSDADFIHASPPCQRYSRLTGWGRKDRVENHPDLIEPVEKALTVTGKPWVIENVEGAPLAPSVLLCAWSFGYEHYRHRIFKFSEGFELETPPHCDDHDKMIVTHGLPSVEAAGRRARSPGHKENGKFHSVGGHSDSMDLAREVMGIWWTMPVDELSESIPPYYTHWIGVQVRHWLEGREMRRQLLDSIRKGGRGPVAQKEIWAYAPSPSGRRERGETLFG